MWLSRVCNRGCVRMRRIFCGLRTLTGWDHPFSAYTGVLPSKTDSTRRTSKVGHPHLQHPRDVLSINTVRRSTYVSKIQETNSG